MKYINDLVNRLAKKGIFTEACSEDDILIIKNIAGKYKLPEAYLEFMRKMGNSNKGRFMPGESCYMNEIEDLKTGAIETLEENESTLTLSEDTFVFWMSQGCMFCFFYLNGDDNPPVYFYNESREDKFFKIKNTLTEFWIDRLEMKKDLFDPID